MKLTRRGFGGVLLGGVAATLVAGKATAAPTFKRDSEYELLAEQPCGPFSEMVTSTLRKHSHEIMDNVTQHNAFAGRFKQYASYEPLVGKIDSIPHLYWTNTRNV